MGFLDGKVAVVTGAGRGIGRATAEMLAEQGARVVACDLDPGPLEETAQAVRALGAEVLTVAGDITDPRLPDRIMAQVAERFGRLDVLVNNAGYTWDGVLHKMTDEQFQAMLDVHLVAPFRMIRAAAPLMRDAAKREMAEGVVVHRKIVNVSSVSGLMGNPGQANYAAAKAGVVGLTKTVAKEWGPFRINCNAVAFGLIETRLTQPKERGEMVQGKAVGIPQEMRATMERMIPLQRPGQAREAAAAILFLASPLSDYVNGMVLKVDGGFYA
ncbi:SDR family NAD(P)-dependent oxidoreductase [Caldinitratiruptor microaerophilus]|uniref:Beta-ketoacyl-ACP reductase n=1 Tax=Caldinitratiruptor microaerophilus TaxID=671077 RepID=A0AA35CLP4_9FIRM|nr:SDR family oxidoreductase [Caldinitratiruptor microaerophilus]BDG59575.1 beta-ketoacyl-ACP reductase [Caldinitratiruptor microaerophilus]